MAILWPKRLNRLSKLPKMSWYRRLLLRHTCMIISRWQRRRLVLLLLLHRMYPLIALCIDTRVNGRFGVREPLVSTLQGCMLGLLPRRDVWRRRDVYSRHGVRVRGHVRLYTLS